MKTTKIENENDLSNYLNDKARYILDEDFEMPIHLMDLQDTIKAACDHYDTLPLNRKETKAFKNKLNELIDEYNDLRQMKIFNHIH